MLANAIETSEQFILKSHISHFGNSLAMTITPKLLLDEISKLKIPYELHRHPPLHTVEESRQFRGQIRGGHCKNLFLKDKKGMLWLIVCLEDTQIAMNSLHKKIGAARLSFGNPQLLFEVLGITPGSVSPFALINDHDRRVNVVLEKNMMAHTELNYHPLTNEQTITIARDDLIVFITACGHQPQIIDLD